MSYESYDLHAVSSAPSEARNSPEQEGGQEAGAGAGEQISVTGEARVERRPQE